MQLNLSSAREDIMITKATYLERRDTSLRAFEMEIARLTDHADRATADVADDYYEAIHRLQASHDKAAKTLRELDAVSDHAWQGKDSAADVEEAWGELREAVVAAISTTYCEASRRLPGRHTTAGPHQAHRARRIAPRGACY